MKKNHWPMLVLLPVIPGLSHCGWIKEREEPVTVKVTCKSQSLAEEIQRVEPGTIVRVIGRCEETKPVVIETHGVALVGGVIDGDPKQPVISVRDARGVTVKDSTVTGGKVGIEIKEGAHVGLMNVSAVKNEKGGILIDGGPVEQESKKQASARRDNGAPWRYLPSRLPIDSEKPASKHPYLLAAKGSPASFRLAQAPAVGDVVTTNLNICGGNYSNNPNGFGLHAINTTVTIASTTASIPCDDVHFDDNHTSGFLATQNSTVDVNGATVFADGNGQAGIGVNNSTINMNPGATVQAQSNSTGIVFKNRGKFRVREATVHANGNTASGIHIDDKSELEVREATVHANGNTASGIHLKDRSKLQVWAGVIESKSNVVGVKVERRSAAFLENDLLSPTPTQWTSTGNPPSPGTTGFDVQIVDRRSKIECQGGSTLTKGTKHGAGKFLCP